MFKLIKSIFPREFHHNPAYWRAFALAMVMLVLIVMQLFRFERYPDLIATFRIPGSMTVAWLIAIALPLLEIASLPYLLSMKVHDRVRRWSKRAVIVTGAAWLALSVWVAVQMNTSVESGIFGATLTTSSGWWMVAFAVLLLWSGWLVTRELPTRK